MLLKLSIAAILAIAVAVPLSRVDYRGLYNEMYPVNGLRRDVLNLCHEAKPTFVRALETDRVGCYDGMPDPVEMAIGWVRTTSRLAAMRRPTAVELAEKLLVEATMPGRDGRFVPRRLTGYVVQPVAVRPCPDTALAALPEPGTALPGNRALARAIASGDAPTLAAFGMLPPRRDALATEATGSGGDDANGRLDATFGDSAPAPAAGCGAPA
jgi:hypothetical protein